MVPRAKVVIFGLGGVAVGIVGNAVTYFLLIYYNQAFDRAHHAHNLATVSGATASVS